MKKALKNYRYYVLGVLVAAACLGIFSEPVETLDFAGWFTVLIISKLVGVGVIYVAYRLVSRWNKQGKIPELTNL